MPSLRLKRGTSDPSASDFSDTAELLVNTTDGGLFTKDDSDNVVEIGSGGISNIVEDTTPQLGGALDVQAQDINTSTSNGNIKLVPNGTGLLEVKGNTNSGTIQLNCENNSHGVKIKGPPHSAGASYTLTLPDDDGSANDVLKSDGSGNLSWTAQQTTYTNSDVDTHLNTGSASTNQVLSWDGSDYDWVAQSGGGGGSSTLSGLTDVTLGTLVNGQVLKYNGSAWINDTDATGGGGGGSTDLLEIMLFT